MMKLFALLALALFCGFAHCEVETPVAAPEAAVADVPVVPVVTEDVKPVEDAPVEADGKYLELIQCLDSD